MTSAEIATSLPARAVTSIDNVSFPRIASGKVREIFDLGDALLLVASDRLSAFDVILPDGIPGKGILLNQISLWWFAQTTHLIDNHLLPDQAGEFARRSITDRVNVARLASIAQEAAEQCRRLTVPRVAPAAPLHAVLDAWDSVPLFVGDERRESPPLATAR